MQKNWPHSPLHQLREQGVYMVTAGTYLKAHYFRTKETLNLVQNRLLTLASEYGWELHAWAVFSNHYHFIGHSPKDSANLKIWLTELHRSRAHAVNQLDNTPNRKVWYQFWDSRITIHSSYLSRLNYVHQNPVKHGLVAQASQYPFCSAYQFEQSASRAFVNSVYSFNYSKVKVFDEF